MEHEVIKTLLEYIKEDAEWKNKFYARLMFIENRLDVQTNHATTLRKHQCQTDDYIELFKAHFDQRLKRLEKLFS